MIIFLKGGLPELDLFIDRMSEGIECEILNLKEGERSLNRLLDLDEEIGPDTVVFTFNGFGTALKLGGSEYFKRKGVKLVNFVVDHPVYGTLSFLSNFYYNYYTVCIDEGHAEFLKDILPPDKVLYVPHGGAFAENIKTDASRSDKEIDVLYVGGFHVEDEINFPLVPDVDSELFYEKIIEFYENEDYVEAQDAVRYFAAKTGYELDAEKLITLTYYAICTVENYYIANRRRTLISSLAQSGVRVTVFGLEKCWKDIAEAYPDTVSYGGTISPQECLMHIANSKILLNDLPYFAKGFHERIFNGMLNKAVVVSNKSKEIERRFEDGKDIILWDGKNYENLVQKIKSLLQNSKELDDIASRAFTKVSDDLWRNRTLEILSKIKD